MPVIAALLYVAPLLLDAPLTDPDEGLHAAISQEMVERGDVIVPRFLGRAFLDKPVLFFWAQAASLRIFGMSAAAARLPGIVFALLGVVTTGWLARVLVRGQGAGGSGQQTVGSGQSAVGSGQSVVRSEQEDTVGWVAAGCYATMVLPFLLAQAPVHDIALVPLTNLALAFLWRAGRGTASGRDPGSGIRDPILAAVALGLSILTKGLEGVAIVGVGYGLYLLFTRTLTWRLVVRGMVVVAVAALIALPWYLAMDAREPGYLRYYFLDRHLLGFTTDTQRHSGQPWWFYLPVVVGGGLPWLAMIRVAGRRAALSGREAPPYALLWTWLVGAVVLLSLAQSKTITYVLPAMPAVAILAAISPMSRRAWRRIAIGTAATCAMAAALFGPQLARAHSARDLADYFNAAGRLPATIFVFDQRVSFVYYLGPDLRRQMHPDQVRSVSVEELAAMHPFPRDAVVTVPIDLAATRLPRIPPLASAQRHMAGRYLVVSPGVSPGVRPR